MELVYILKFFIGNPKIIEASGAMRGEDLASGNVLWLDPGP